MRLLDPDIVVRGIRVVSTTPVEQEDVHVRLRIPCAALSGSDVRVAAGHSGRQRDFPICRYGLVHYVQPIVARSDEIHSPTDLNHLHPVEVEHIGVDRSGRP